LGICDERLYGKRPLSHFGAEHNFLDVIQLGASTRVFQVPSNTVEDIIAASEHGNMVVSGNSYRGELNLWNFDKITEQSSNTRHSEEIINVLSVLGGTRFVTASMDWTARLWQTRTGSLIQRYGGTPDTGYGKGLAKTVADDRFLVGYTFRTAIYDAESGEQLYSFKPPCDGVTAIGMAPSGRFFATGSSDGILLIFSENVELLWQAKVSNDAEITCTEVSEDDGWIVWGDTSGNLTLFDVQGGVTKQISGEDGIGCVMFWPGSDIFYSGHKSGKLDARNARTELIMADIQAHSDRVTAFSRIDSDVIASASWDGKVAFLNWTTLTQ
jgi:WD40 repeat protein